MLNKILKLSLVFLLPMLISATANDELGSVDRIRAHKSIEGLVQPTLDSFFKGARFENYPKAEAFFQFEFDKAKFDKAKSVHDKKANAQKNALENAKQRRFQNYYKSVVSGKTNDSGDSAQKVRAAKPKSQRFGRLNIDIDPIAIEEIIEDSTQVAAGAPQITLQVPSSADLPTFDFIYDPITFVKDLKITLSLPDNVDDEQVNRLKDRIGQAVLFTGLIVNKDSAYKIEKLAPISSGSGFSIMDWIFAPSNSTIGILMAAIIIGIFAMICMLLLSKVFSRIAASIAELRPEPVAESTGGSSSTADDMPSPSSEKAVIVNAEVEDISARAQSHDHAATLSAMTSEMRTIRDQLAGIISDNAVVTAELLRDLCYEKHGMEDFRDLLSFSGYNTLKEAMEKLPESVIVQLQTYIEDNRDSQVDLIRGCEVAQRIYRDTVSKISVRAEETDHIKNLKSVILKINDGPIDLIVDSASAEELSLILRLLSVERGNRLMKSLEGQKLKEACDLLDIQLENEEQIAKGLAEKLTEAQKDVKSGSQLQTRFIIRLAKTATIDEEQSLIELIPAEDWDLKLNILKGRFLYSFVKYFPTTELRAVFDTFDLAKRAEILFVSEDEVKAALLSQYEEGSKVFEMLNDELGNVENNKKRNEQVRKNRIPLIEELLGSIRNRVAAHEELITETLKNEFNANGTPLPEGVVENESEQEAAA